MLGKVNKGKSLVHSHRPTDNPLSEYLIHVNTTKMHFSCLTHVDLIQSLLVEKLFVVSENNIDENHDANRSPDFGSEGLGFDSRRLCYEFYPWER